VHTRKNALLVQQHSNIERKTAQGGTVEGSFMRWFRTAQMPFWKAVERELKFFC
jgi:hypothetical protein